MAKARRATAMLAACCFPQQVLERAQRAPCNENQGYAMPHNPSAEAVSTTSWQQESGATRLLIAQFWHSCAPGTPWTNTTLLDLTLKHYPGTGSACKAASVASSNSKLTSAPLA